jgi:toxin-antitoxin system PIN domain toxin
MILVDANLLVYAHVASSPGHDRARDWLDAQLNGSSQVALPWPSVLAFVRLVSNARIFARPLPVSAAWKQAASWLDLPVVWMPVPTERHREILGQLFDGVGFRPNLVPDAHLAALAIEHGLTLCSADGDFARFQGLRWENPLAA